MLGTAKAGLGLFPLVLVLPYQVIRNLNIILGINSEYLSEALASEDTSRRPMVC